MAKYFKIILLDENDNPVDGAEPLAVALSYGEVLSTIQAYSEMPDFLAFINPAYSFGIFEYTEVLKFTYKVNSI